VLTVALLISSILRSLKRLHWDNLMAVTAYWLLV
jgi:hypothetical protein